jgi:hypothetical protein
MLRFIVGAFLVLHGLVHLLYFGQGWRLFELQPGMLWPDGSWVFSRLLGDEATRWLASISCVLAALGFVIGGVTLLLKQVWWRPAIVGVAIFSAMIFILFWNGRTERLDNQGFIAILINLAILTALLVLQWTPID